MKTEKVTAEERVAHTSTPWTDPELKPLVWRDKGDGEYHASKGYPEVGAIVGKVWRKEDGKYRFDCSAWGGNGKQNANGDMPTLEDAKAMVEIVTQGPRPSSATAHEALVDALRAAEEDFKDAAEEADYKTYETGKVLAERLERIQSRALVSAERLRAALSLATQVQK